MKAKAGLEDQATAAKRREDVILAALLVGPLTRSEIFLKTGIQQAKADAALLKLCESGLITYDLVPSRSYTRLGQPDARVRRYSIARV